MRFDAPQWLWLALPLAAYLLWLSRKSYAQLYPWAARSALILRLVIVALLLAALAQPVISRRTGRNQLVCLLDVSQSVSAENLEAALRDIEKLAEQRPSRTELSVIAFGADAKVVLKNSSGSSGWPDELREQILYQKSLPSLYAERTQVMTKAKADSKSEIEKIDGRIMGVEQFRDQVAGDHTDIERAMRLGLNCGSTTDQRTIYLFTDANFNRGEWRRALDQSSAAGATLHPVRFDKALPPEVAATEVVLPEKVRINQGFTAEIHVVSNHETTGRLALFKDGYQFQEQDVSLRQGRNLFHFGGLYFRDKGFHTVEATVRAKDDTQPANNTARSLVVVPGEARVLYVDKDEDQIPYLKSALELEGIRVDARPGGGVPNELSELLSYDALILSNVPADRLSMQQMRMIQTYVEEFGGGFVMLGGEESFGPGGFYDTPIEEVLPVSMPIRKDMLRPSLALLLVIDKSGSMQGVKIQLAKRAAVATAEVINPRDQIGVIGFDGASKVVLELTPAADRATVISHISNLDAGGGTFLYPALEDARDRLQGSNAKRKHVIVLSDGQTQGAGYEEFVGALAADGITVSAVGIGEGADMRLLEAIAQAGSGRAYFTNDFYSIPQIFTREALRASKNMLVERLFQPMAIGDDVSLREIDVDELPLLSGYVATTPKSKAQTLLVSDSGDPLLAKWRYGLGRTVAFTSETKPRWAEDWIEWPDFAKFWSQLIRSVTGENLAQTVSVECAHEVDDDGVLLTADIRDAADTFLTDVDLKLVAVDVNARSRELPVTQVGPGLFQSRVPQIAYGRDAQFSWQVQPEGKPVQTATYGYVYSFSPEFRTMGVDDEVLQAMQSAGASPPVSVGQAELQFGQEYGLAQLHLWPYLLIAALILIPIDILCRRMG